MTVLVTIVSLLIGSILYFITVLVSESDDTNASDSLAIDEREFSTTPATSPACDNINHHHHAEVSPVSLERAQQIRVDEQQNVQQACEDLITLATITEARPQVDTALSSATKEVIDQVGSGTSVIDTQPQSHQQQQADLKGWPSSANSQKSLITNQLGVPASKLLFEEFDTKEMQLGGTGLHWCNTRKSLDKLVKLGLPLNVENKRRETPLHVAVRRRKLPLLIGLLSHGADVNHKNEMGETPLILACRINDIFACQALLVYDSDVDAKDKLGLSSRHYVAANCDKHKVQQRLPSASHLILAMLNELGASRCKPAVKQQQQQQQIAANSTGTTAKVNKHHSMANCTDGCAHDGGYTGNSYNRWPNYQKESLFKRHMFSDIIEDSKKVKPSVGKQAESADCHDETCRLSRMLCIDGGGMRGVIVCQIMIEMEKYLKRPLVSYFDWIGGTSVGAFLACAMCLGVSLRKLRRICFDVKDEVFSGNKPYNSKFLERVLKRTYGQSTRMSDIKNKKLAVTTVIADRDPCQLRFFRNYRSPAELLELYGYPADVYDIMSAHSIVPQREILLPKSAIKSTTSKSIISLVSEKMSNSNQSPASSLQESSASKSLHTATKMAEKQQQQQQQLSTKTVKNIAAKVTNDDENFMDDPNNKQQLPSEYVIDESERDPLVWQAVRASAAAPFFFKPYGPYLDGGIISNNPTLDIMSEFHAYERVKSFLRARINANTTKNPVLSKDDKRLKAHEEPPCKLNLVLSLGTGRGRVVGHQAMIDFGNVASGLSTVFSPVELLRSIRAARDLFKKLMHRSCMTDDHILDRAQAWCSSLGIPYFRISPPLATIFSIDDKRDEQLINALWQTKLYMRAMRPQLQQLGDLMDADDLSPKTASVLTGGTI